MFVFREIWRALFSCSTRFEISPFALLPTKCTTKVMCFKQLYWFSANTDSVIRTSETITRTNTRTTTGNLLRTILQKIKSEDSFTCLRITIKFCFLNNYISLDSFTWNIQDGRMGRELKLSERSFHIYKGKHILFNLVTSVKYLSWQSTVEFYNAFIFNYYWVLFCFF